MSPRRVLRWMTRLCSHTGLSVPECCCRHCFEALLWRYAPALLDIGPLDLPCASRPRALEAAGSYAPIEVLAR